MNTHSFDKMDLWDPDSIDAIVFNRFAGPSAVLEYDNGAMTIRKVNQGYLKELCTGGSCEDLPGRNPWEHFGREDRRRYEETVKNAIASGGEETCETERIIFSPLCGQESVWIRSTLRRIAREGEKALLHVTVRNITAEKESYRELQESEQRFRYASEQINEYAWVYDIPTKEMRPCFRCMRDLGLPALLRNYPEPAIEMGIFPQDYADMYRD